MNRHDYKTLKGMGGLDHIFDSLMKENDVLRSEIRVSHEAAEITTKLVIEQFEKAEAIMNSFQSTSGFLKAVMDAALQMAIVATDLNGRIILFNRGAELMLGYTEAEAKRMMFTDVIESSDLMDDCLTLLTDVEELVRDREKHLDLINKVTSKINEGIFRKSNGDTFPVSFAITPIRDKKNVTGCLSVAMDISSLKMAELNLKEAYNEISDANERLTKLDRLKSDFLSSVSHELRTPLTSIRGFSRLILKDFERFFKPLSDDPKIQRRAEKIEENLNIILTETERLTRLINDVLDLSKIESQRTEWREERVNLQEMLMQAINAARGQFSDRSELELIVKLPEKLPDVFSDRDRLVQVVVNLLNNAAKFTSKGSVTVSARERGDGYVQVDVADTGCGFPQEEAEAVFDKFRQVCQGDTLAQKPTGTGLGLSICQEIINRFGGRIWASSELNVGSTFSFTLPVMARDFAPVSDDDGDTENSEKLILVVDDELAIRSLLTQFFAHYGFRVISADNGKLAVELAKKYKPDLITMDLEMPVMDGKTAIDSLKKDIDLKDIPVIVLSAFNDIYNTKGDLTFDKPINEQRLIDSVYMLLNRQKIQNVHSCLIICPDSERDKIVVPHIMPEHLYSCSVDELNKKLEEGYRGLVVITSDVMDLVDMKAISANDNVQLLILPYYK